MPTPDSLPPKPHPRLFLTPDRIAALKSPAATDEISGLLREQVLATARGFLDAKPSVRELEGRRLLGVSRAVLSRVSHLAMAAVLTGEEPYLRRAVQEMEAAAAFTDWNPSHFLDVSEMTLALAIGYDWLYDHLKPDERDRIAAAILEKGIQPSLDETTSQNWWVKGHNNWNQVCHAGVTAGALAVAERDPALAGRIVARAIERVPLACGAYAPDGAYAEGPMYWNYGTSFHVTLIDALTTALGHEGGLADTPGFLASAHYILQATGPGGRLFNYSDCVERRDFDVPLFWFARRLGEPALLASDVAALREARRHRAEHPGRELSRLLPLALVWWQPEFAARVDAPAGLPKNWHGRGEVPVGIHRSAWGDAGAAFVALKGGCPSAPHGHMDGGAFVSEAGGVRWAADLGMQDYHSLESRGIDLWNSRAGSDRWRVFRVGGESHNILRFNGAPQLVAGRVPIVRFRGEGDWPHTVVDLSEIYSDHAARVWRGVALGANGQVLWQDEWTAGDGLALNVRWQMLTHAEIVPSTDGRRIALRQDGKEYVLRVLLPADARVEVLDVSRPAHDFDAPNPGARLLVLHTRTAAGGTGTFRLVGALAGTAAAEAAPPSAQPLAAWSAPDETLAATA